LRVPIYVDLEARDERHGLAQARIIQNLLDQATVQMQLKVSGVQAIACKVMVPQPIR
jgi:hypothetical protein